MHKELKPYSHPYLEGTRYLNLKTTMSMQEKRICNHILLKSDKKMNWADIIQDSFISNHVAGKKLISLARLYNRVKVEIHQQELPI